DRVADVVVGPVRVRLDRGAELEHAGDGTWRSRGKQLHGPEPGVPGVAHHEHMGEGEAAHGRAEHGARRAGHVLDPGAGARDLGPRPRVVHPGQDHVVERVGTDLEGVRQLPELRAGHGPARRGARHVEGPPQPVAGEEVRHAEVEWMAVVPARGDVRPGVHGSPPAATRSRAALAPRSPATTRAMPAMVANSSDISASSGTATPNASSMNAISSATPIESTYPSSNSLAVGPNLGSRGETEKCERTNRSMVWAMSSTSMGTARLLQVHASAPRWFNPGMARRIGSARP